MPPRLVALLSVLVAASTIGVVAHADSLDVDARCNIFGASHPVPPPADSGGVGILPVSIPLAAIPGLQVAFPSVTGRVGCCGTLSYNLDNGPDGGTNASGNTDVTSVGGIAGIIDRDHTMFLVGVFTADSEAVDPAPDRLDFSSGQITENYRVLSPQLDQTFYVGDGLEFYGFGAVQVVNVPPGATRMWLGFADSYQFGDPSGPPMYYDDNVGSLHVEYEVIDANAATVTGVNDAIHGFAMLPVLGDPRRGGCRIRFILPSAQAVSVTLYDVSSRRVRELAGATPFPAGHVEVPWDGRDTQGARVRGGVYFARVSCPAGTGTARVFAIP